MVPVENPKIPPLSPQDDENANLGRDSEKGLQSKLSEQNKKTIEEATNMLHEYQEEAHQQAVAQWNLKRRERKQLERDLLQYQVNTVHGRNPTDQEIDQARIYINNKHAMKLREELPYISWYF